MLRGLFRKPDLLQSAKHVGGYTIIHDFFVKTYVQNDKSKIKDQRSAKHVGGWTIINIINNIDSQRLIAIIVTNIQYSHH